jgi:hypothetical protein
MGREAIIARFIDRLKNQIIRMHKRANATSTNGRMYPTLGREPISGIVLICDPTVKSVSPFHNPCNPTATEEANRR